MDESTQDNAWYLVSVQWKLLPAGLCDCYCHILVFPFSLMVDKNQAEHMYNVPVGMDHQVWSIISNIYKIEQWHSFCPK